VTQGKSGHGKTKPYSLDWERVRVQRWLEIVSDEPLDINLKSTQLRMHEFTRRYERLEAEVPTP